MRDEWIEIGISGMLEAIMDVLPRVGRAYMCRALTSVLLLMPVIF